MRIGLTVQNNTHELLTVEGSSVLNGSWQNQPLYGDTVLKLSTSSYWSEMDPRWESGPNSWLIAWIRFGTTKGYVKIGGAYNADVQGSGLSDEDRKREIATGGPNSPFRAHVFVPRLLDAQVFVTGIDPDIYVQVFLAARVHPRHDASIAMLGAGAARFVPELDSAAKLKLVRAPAQPSAVQVPADLVAARAETPTRELAAPGTVASAQPDATPQPDANLYEESVPIKPIHTGMDWNKAPFI